MIDEIIKKLHHKKIKFDNLQFLAGDASDRKYFLIKQKNNTNVLMVDKNSENLERFLLILSKKTGIDTSEMSYISPLWTYKLLTLMSGLMIIGEFFAFVS